MDKDLKPVTTVPTNSTVGMGELVEDPASGRKPAGALDDGEKQSEELGSPPLGLVYSSKEDATVRWKLDLILLPMVSGYLQKREHTTADRNENRWLVHTSSIIWTRSRCPRLPSLASRKIWSVNLQLEISTCGD
jgi:hypothetical protein